PSLGRRKVVLVAGASIQIRCGKTDPGLVKGMRDNRQAIAKSRHPALVGTNHPLGQQAASTETEALVLAGILGESKTMGERLGERGRSRFKAIGDFSVDLSNGVRGAHVVALSDIENTRVAPIVLSRVTQDFEVKG